jgi:hypothetical protein
MTEPTDPRMAFVLMVKEHLKSQHVQNIAKVLVSDQYIGFWDAPFSHSSGRWDSKGGLVEATLLGYRALRYLCATANQLFAGKVDEDRLVAIYLTIMVSRWCNVRTKQITFERTQPCSVISVALANAVALGIDLTPAEAQAITNVHASRSELMKDHEGFTSEWWVISETLNWVFVGNRR